MLCFLAALLVLAGLLSLSIESFSLKVVMLTATAAAGLFGAVTLLG